MVLAAIVIGIAAGFYARSLPKTYSSRVEFFVKNEDMYTDTVSNTATPRLVNDYVKIMKSDVALEKLSAALKEQHGIEMSPGAIRGLISHSYMEDSSAFSVIVTHSDADVAYKLALTIESEAPQIVTDISKNEVHIEKILAPSVAETIRRLSEMEKYKEYGVSLDEPKNFDKMIEDFLKTETTLLFKQICFVSINSPVKATYHSSPNESNYVTVGAAAAAVIVYIIFFVKGLFEMKVSSEDDIKKLVSHPLIGTIPTWESASKKYERRYSKKYYGKNYAKKYENK